jgi:glycosyltransferase involved in cell wall biosynthesis
MNDKVLKAAADSEGHLHASSVPGTKFRIAVGVATAGRKTILGYTLELIAQQTRLPDLLIVCPAGPEDLDADSLERFPFTTAVRTGKRGLTAQRNQILSAADAADLIIFFDDDFFPQLNYIEEAEKIFLDNSDVVAVTGRPIRDGANGPGLEVEAALGLISVGVPIPSGQDLLPTYGTYGCNMGFRMDPIRQRGLSFDENLPLYGWQEDIDFSRQLSVFGRIVDAMALRGVHLGAKSGRTSGVRFGYAQIANPVYMVRKGTMSMAFAGSLIGRNVLANLGKSFRPEPWIDRRGRLRGNWLALRDFVTGGISPRRILDFT